MDKKKKIIIGALVIAVIIDVLQFIFICKTDFNNIKYSAIVAVFDFIITYNFMKILTNDNKMLLNKATIVVALSSYAISVYNAIFVMGVELAVILINLIARPKVLKKKKKEKEEKKELNKPLIIVGIVLTLIVSIGFKVYTNTYITSEGESNGLTASYGFMFNFMKPFISTENFDWSTAFTIIGVFPIPLVILLYYLFKKNKHEKFLMPMAIGMSVVTVLSIMYYKLPQEVRWFVTLNDLIFIQGYLGLCSIFYLMSNDDEVLFSLQASIWITMALLIVSIFVPLPTAIADKNWRTLFCVPYTILAFLTLNYNREKKYQRWLMWNLVFFTILETGFCIFS